MINVVVCDIIGEETLNLSMNHTHKKVGNFHLLKNKILFCQEVAKDE